VLSGAAPLIGPTGSWLGPADLACHERVEKEFSRLARQVDPDDPWSHPDAPRLDELSFGAWLQAAGATPPVLRRRELEARGLATESIFRTSLLAELRGESAAGAVGFYRYEVWESLRVAEGSATVADRMAVGLGERIRYETPVSRIEIGPRRCTVTIRGGEQVQAQAVICALPVGPLRQVDLVGVSAPCLASLARQRQSPAAKAVFVYGHDFWAARGQNGSAFHESGLLTGVWPQRPGVLSSLLSPDRLGSLLAVPEAQLPEELTTELAVSFGPGALDTEAVHLRLWGTDPWAQGYISAWRPGDLTAVGPLHATHEPPFYVCGSDHWVAGYMEGAVRTGRAAAAAALADTAKTNRNRT
jgi:monoamine oxidase